MASVRNVVIALFLMCSLPLLPKAITTTGEAYARVWKGILEMFGNEPLYLFTIGTLAAFGIPFWLVILAFMPLDLWGKPEFLLTYKVQSDKNVPVTWSTYRRSLNIVNKNQLVSTLMILFVYPVTQWQKIPYQVDQLPSAPEFFLQFVYFVIVQEIGFYYLHRLMHHPLLYKRIHKVHHEWTAPITLAVVHVHPIEHIVVNMIPILLSPILINAHLSSSWIWYGIATYVSTIHHCGYHFPWMPSPEFHDFHHLKFNQCFGTIGLLDWLHKTDELYRKSENFKNDKLLTTFMPISRAK